jgi:hypothetical protein
MRPAINPASHGGFFRVGEEEKDVSAGQGQTTQPGKGRRVDVRSPMRSNQLVAQASRLYKRRLKPAATKTAL